MNYCKRCVMPDTKPGLTLDEDGVCQACRHHEMRACVDWNSRFVQLEELTARYRRSDGFYDCIVTVSGGKDSWFQTYVMKVLLKMNPLCLNVQDPFTRTDAGRHNLGGLSEFLGCDVVSFRLSSTTCRRMLRAAFEEYGSPTWPIDRAIYTYPLHVAGAMKIPLVVYGEDVSYVYGGPLNQESYSAKNQLDNDVVKPIDWQFFLGRGVSDEALPMLKAPPEEVLRQIDPIYLSYFFPWDGYNNYLIAKQYGFRDLTHEWEREGYIENYDQIDSIGYLVHPWLKYPKYGFARATDVASYWIRSGRISRDEAISLVREHDHRLDQRALADFLMFAGYSPAEFWSVVDRFWNRDIFASVDGQWRLSNPVWAR